MTRTQLSVAEQQLGMRAEALYKQGGSSLLNVLMSTGSFDDLLSQAEFFRRLSASDSDIVDAIERHRDKIRSTQAQLAADLARAQRLAAAREQQQAGIETALRQRQTLLVGIRAQVERIRQAAAARESQATVADEPAAPTGGTVTVPGEGAWWPLIQTAAADNGISAQGLYRLMNVESGGVATARNGSYCGLFQYSEGTWRGSWNPWRGRDIFDGEAQIRATALAIAQGRGPSWWPTTYAWAFSGT